MQELINQFPVVTEHLVDMLNSNASVHWSAELRDWMLDLSAQAYDRKNKTGNILDGADITFVSAAQKAY